MLNHLSLYELTTEALAIESLLDQLGGEIPDGEIEGAIDALLADNSRRLDDKLDAYAALITSVKVRAVFRHQEAKRLGQLAHLDQVKAEKLLERLKLYFERTGEGKVETPRFSISLVSNGGKRPLLLDEALDPATLPAELRRHRYEADRERIRQMLEAGAAYSFARLGERGSSIRIK